MHLSKITNPIIFASCFTIKTSFEPEEYKTFQSGQINNISILMLSSVIYITKENKQ